MDLQENQEDLKEIKQKPRDKTLFFVKIFFVLFLFLAIAITVSSFSLFNLIMILFESLLIYPFCLLIANEKNYTKTTFFVLLIFFTISSFHMIYFCYNVNQYPGMLNPAFWLLLLLYLIASKIILINSLEKKEVSTFKLFKLRTYNTFKKKLLLIIIFLSFIVNPIFSIIPFLFLTIIDRKNFNLNIFRDKLSLIIFLVFFVFYFSFSDFTSDARDYCKTIISEISGQVKK